MVSKVYNEELCFHEFKGDFVSIFPEIEVGENNWFFSVDEKTESQVTLTVLEIDSKVVNSDLEYFVGNVLFSFTRNWDGRNIYHFGDAPVRDVRSDEMGSVLNNTVYTYNQGVAGFEDLGGVERFANILLTSTRVANKFLNQESGKNVKDEFVLYPVVNLIPVSDGV